MAQSVTAEELQDFLNREFEMTRGLMVIEEVGEDAATVRFKVGAMGLRPGGTVMGPMVMTLADTSIFCALCVATQPTLTAYTTNLNINFLTKPEAGDLISRARIIRVGKTLVMGEASIRSSAAPDVIAAHATATFILGG